MSFSRIIPFTQSKLQRADYLAMSKHTANISHSLASQIIKSIILPSIEHEVNTAQNFASLRQMFYSMILASWYKTALKNAILTKIYGNQSKGQGRSQSG